MSSTSQFFSDSSEQDVMTASKQRCKDDVGALSMAKEEQDNEKMACKNQPWAHHVVVMESSWYLQICHTNCLTRPQAFSMLIS